MPNEFHESPSHCLATGGIGIHLRASRETGGSASRLAAAALLILTLLANGCARSTPHQVASVKQALDAAEAVSTTESGEVLRQPTANPDFSGKWSVEWCSKTNPELDCGGFTVTLA